MNIKPYRISDTWYISSKSTNTNRIEFKIIYYMCILDSCIKFSLYKENSNYIFYTFEDPAPPFNCDLVFSSEEEAIDSLNTFMTKYMKLQVFS